MKNYLVILSILGLLWASCANPVALSGGAEDKQAPGIVKDGIFPKNEKTSFKKEPVYFTFDEWVKLDDVINQVVVSPPLEHSPKIKIKGKTVSFEFDEKEELREETTYTINFGEAVKDLTEGNPAKDLRYVFSTGMQIDSLSIQGKVVDAIEQSPVENALVMLYQNLSDTVFRTEKPYYFSRTDQGGNFKIQNIKEGRFQAFVLGNDQGQKYIFDHPEEFVGYPEEFVLINDTSKINLNLSVFKEKAPLQIRTKKDEIFGHVLYSFNRDPYDIDLSFSEGAQGLISEIEKDSIHIWYATTDSFAIYTAYDTLWNDTLEIKKKSLPDFKTSANLEQVNGQRGSIILSPIDIVKIQFNHPIRSINKDSISLLRDSLKIEEAFEFEIDAAHPRDLALKSNWKELSNYVLYLYPGAIEDMFGIKNDTMMLKLQASEIKSFGSIEVKIEELDASKEYLVEINDAADKSIDSFTVSDKTSVIKEYKYLLPGEYTIKIIEDLNANGRWDEGSFDQKKYPEKIFSQKLETLRANWSVEANIKPTF